MCDHTASESWEAFCTLAQMQSPVIFNWFDVIVLLGSIQAGVFAFILLWGNGSTQSVRLFSFTLLTFAALALKIELHTLGLWNSTAFHYFPLAIDTLLPVLLYAYLRVVTGRPLNPTRLLLYLIPSLLFLLHALIVYFLVLAQPSLTLKDALAEKLWYNSVKNVEDAITMTLALICWLAGYRELTRYREWLYSTQSDTRLEEYTWLRKLLVLSGLLALLFSISTWLLPRRFIILQGFYIYLAIISYYLSLKGYQLYGTGRQELLLVSCQS